MVLIRDHQPDIILCQEIQASEDQLKQLVPGYNILRSRVEGDRKPGITMLYKIHLEALSRVEVLRGRLQFVDFGPIKVFNLYAHSGHNKMVKRVEFFKTELFENTQGGGKFLIGGNLNCVTRRQDIQGHFKDKY